MRLATIYNPLAEATMEWCGPIHILLGNDEPETLHWGTGSPDRPPFLYVPIGLSHIRAVIRHLQDATAWYDTLRRVGGIGGAQVDYPEYFEVIPKVGRQLKHVGEAHLTVAMGEDATGLSRRSLLQAGLFDQHGNGVPTPVGHTGKFKVLRAPYYRDQSDPDGPLLVAEEVQVPALDRIRERLGLRPLAQLRVGGVPYIPHITIGYAAAVNQVHRSYVSRHGARLRTRS